MANNGLPNQTAKVTQPPTKAVDDYGVFNMISGITDIIGKTVDSLTPAADSLMRYQLAKQTIKNQNTLALDGSQPIDSSGGLFQGGLSNGNNQTLLIIAGLAAAAVAVIILAK